MTIETATTLPPVPLCPEGERELRDTITELRARLADPDDAFADDQRVVRLERFLARAVITEPGERRVAVGHTVVLHDGEFERVYRIVCDHTGQPGTVSVESPMAEALLGLQPGEDAVVTLPSGRERSLRVLRIEGFR